MFGDTKKLLKDREQNISSCFPGVLVRFLYPQTLDDFKIYFDFFQMNRENDIVNDIAMGEKIYLISLLSWTTFLVLLTDLMTLQTF